VWSTWARLDTLPKGVPVPIGRPIPGASISVRDSRGVPVPIGVAGELYIGGPGVARGYVDRVDDTTRRFLTDQRDSSRRLYRTFDLVRLDADGVLTFLGRTDSQVKIRGFRIEPLEIETVLRGHPDVADAVVTTKVRDDITDHRAVLVDRLLRHLETLSPAAAHAILSSVE
jgi:non-ribosomal peptide synthetase component F